MSSQLHSSSKLSQRPPIPTTEHALVWHSVSASRSIVTRLCAYKCTIHNLLSLLFYFLSVAYDASVCSILWCRKQLILKILRASYFQALICYSCMQFQKSSVTEIVHPNFEVAFLLKKSNPRKKTAMWLKNIYKNTPVTGSASSSSSGQLF